MLKDWLSLKKPLRKVRASLSTDAAAVLLMPQNVHRSLSTAGSNLMLEFCDLGPIREWGTPINRDRSSDF